MTEAPGVDLEAQAKTRMRLHGEAGQISRYKDKDREGKPLPRKERWGDATQHCLVEAAAAEILADMLNLQPQGSS